MIKSELIEFGWPKEKQIKKQSEEFFKERKTMLNKEKEKERERVNGIARRKKRE
jgi:hypothetical protein